MKETLYRALRTFFQTAVGYLAANLVCVLSGITEAQMKREALMGLAVSAVAAGLAAVMNLHPHTGAGTDDTGQGEDESGQTPTGGGTAGEEDGDER